MKPFASSLPAPIMKVPDGRVTISGHSVQSRDADPYWGAEGRVIADVLPFFQQHLEF